MFLSPYFISQIIVWFDNEQCFLIWWYLPVMIFTSSSVVSWKYFNILNFELSTEEMDQISNLNSENYRIVTREKMDDKDPPMGNCVPDWD